MYSVGSIIAIVKYLYDVSVYLSQAEKRVYQLELMNREKNYNKLFNVNPQVGVLNPLQLKVCNNVVFQCSLEVYVL